MPLDMHLHLIAWHHMLVTLYWAMAPAEHQPLNAIYESELCLSGPGQDALCGSVCKALESGAALAFKFAISRAEGMIWAMDEGKC